MPVCLSVISKDHPPSAVTVRATSIIDTFVARKEKRKEKKLNRSDNSLELNDVAIILVWSGPSAGQCKLRTERIVLVPVFGRLRNGADAGWGGERRRSCE
jgi:hypothetical protein